MTHFNLLLGPYGRVRRADGYFARTGAIFGVSAVEYERQYILAGVDFLLSEGGELRFHTSPLSREER